MSPLAPLGLALLLAQTPPAGRGKAGVTDDAKMFSPEAVARASDGLAALSRASGWDVAIHTIPSLGGKPAKDVAVAEASAAKIEGLYLLISRDDHKFFAEPSSHARSAFPKAAIDALTAPILADFPKGRFDQGLDAVIAEVRKAALAHPSGRDAVGVRDRANLFSAEAIQKADEALRTYHRQTGWQVAVATVDSLKGEDVRRRAAADAAAAKVHGVFLLIDKTGHKIGLVPGESAADEFPRSKLDAIVADMQRDFLAREFDGGLQEAVKAITALTGPIPVDPPNGVRHARIMNPAAPTDEAESPLVPAAPAKPRADAPAAVPESTSNLPLYLGLGAAGLVVLWLLSKAFSPRPSGVAPAPPPAPGYGPTTGPVPPTGYGPAARPMPPGGGYAPPPPGYGPPPGYAQGGYGPPAGGGGGGGGFISGALGGLGGAIAGNILYDKFGRPHEGPAHEGHVGGSAGYIPPATGGPEHVTPPAETYDPNAGVEGSWDAAGPAAAPTAPDDWVGSDVGAGAADGAGGDWSDGSAAAPDWGQPAAPSDEGDWGSPPPDAPDEGAGGDWAAPAPDPDEGQGGGW